MFSTYLKITEKTFIHSTVLILNFIPVFKDISITSVSSDGSVRHAVLARVLINDSLFVLCAISLAVCIFKIAKMSSANVYLESKVEGWEKKKKA